MMLSKAESTLKKHAGNPDLPAISGIIFLYRETVKGEKGNVSITVYMKRASLQQD